MPGLSVQGMTRYRTVAECGEAPFICPSGSDGYANIYLIKIKRIIHKKSTL